MDHKPMKIVWSVDPFESDKRELEALKACITPFLKGGARAGKSAGVAQASLSAVYVASPSESALSTAFDVPAEERLTAYPRKLLTQRLKEIGLRLPPEQLHVLAEPSTSRKAATDRLCAFARMEGATFIAVATHARKGLRKAVLGSFTETLVHRSPVSLLVSNPTVHPQPAIRTILFATDLQKPSRKSFVRVLHLATWLKANVVLFHASEPFIQNVSAPTNRLVEQEKELKALARLRAKTEVRVETVIDTRLADIATRIRKQATRHAADLIVVTAQSSTMKGLLLGSVTRNLLRESTLPLLIEKI
jgi:nucleotide-binding universal stress UspA family protein